jgi:hypothetical protein
MNKLILLLIPLLFLTACETLDERERDDEENELYKREIVYREKIMLEEENELLDETQEQEREKDYTDF